MKNKKGSTNLFSKFQISREIIKKCGEKYNPFVWALVVGMVDFGDSKKC